MTTDQEFSLQIDHVPGEEESLHALRSRERRFYRAMVEDTLAAYGQVPRTSLGSLILAEALDVIEVDPADSYFWKRVGVNLEQQADEISFFPSTDFAIRTAATAFRAYARALRCLHLRERSAYRRAMGRVR